MMDFSNKPLFAYNHLVEPLLAPITRQASVRLLEFDRRFFNQEKLILSLDQTHTLHYYTQGLYRHGLFERHPDAYDSGFYMWDHLPYDPGGIYAHVRRTQNIAHGLTIIQKKSEYSDIFLFATTPNNTCVNNFYLNQKELFTNFMEDFQKTMAPTLAELSKHTVFVPFNTSAAAGAVRTLTPRQQDCARLMCEGLTTKEIAKALGISPRTVQEYIDTIKCKFGARNRLHLQGMLERYI